MGKRKHRRIGFAIPHPPSLKDEVIAYRKKLNNDMETAFDEVFCLATELYPFHNALKVLVDDEIEVIFAAAKEASELLKKNHPLVDVDFLPEES